MVLKARFEDAGYEVSVQLPPACAGKDYNELLRSVKARERKDTDM